jgi:hypothetical protein
MFHLIHLVLAAQQHQAREREQARLDEEVLMTSYRPDETASNWQFKIVKGTFKTAPQVEAVRKEQAEHGWILVEIFDQNRIRFKRLVSEADNDAYREGNPYATVSKASGPGCGAALLLAGTLVGATAGLCWWIA